MKHEAYRVITAPTLRELQQEVNSQLSLGYKPIGGFFVTNLGRLQFYQPMFVSEQ